MMGGEKQSSLAHDSGYYRKAQLIGKPSYLEPISGSLHVPIEGVYSTAERREDRSRIGEKTAQNHVENQEQPRTYLERIRNRMHEPIEGLSSQVLQRLIKREGVSRREQQSKAKTHTKAHRRTLSNRKDPNYDTNTTHQNTIIA